MHQIHSPCKNLKLTEVIQKLESVEGFEISLIYRRLLKQMLEDQGKPNRLVYEDFW